MVVGGTKVTVPAACSPEDCKVRDLLTRPAAIDKTLRMWLPPNSHVYIGSTEPPSFLTLYASRIDCTSRRTFVRS